eukprot:TRINITY_DN4408_c0_g1_i2.p1 TRINITY_DN4408_c0_g1~~TRINITY_DN4408_c0_g1_i2.p1  ORF type:complete len:242 (-),score=25.54 TRINITY_DN4408_c0_g1_i2:302-1027(-)
MCIRDRHGEQANLLLSILKNLLDCNKQRQASITDPIVQHSYRVRRMFGSYQEPVVARTEKARSYQTGLQILMFLVIAVAIVRIVLLKDVFGALMDFLGAFLLYNSYAHVDFCMLLVFIIIYLNSFSVFAIAVGREVQSWYFSGQNKNFFTPHHVVVVVLMLFQAGAIAYTFHAYREFKAYHLEGGGLVMGGAFPMPGGRPVGGGLAARADEEDGGIEMGADQGDASGAGFRAFQGRGVTIG